MPLNKLQFTGVLFGLFMLAILSLPYWPGNTNHFIQESARKVEDRLNAQQAEWEDILKDTAFFSIASQAKTLPAERAESLQAYLKRFENLPFNAYWTIQDSLAGWLNGKRYPLPQYTSQLDTQKFVLQQMPHGYFLLRRDTLRMEGQAWNFQAGFPLFFSYDYQNPKLESRFPPAFQLHELLSFSATITPYPIYWKGKAIGYLQNEGMQLPPVHFWAKVLLWLAALISLGVLLHLIAERLNRKKNWLGPTFMISAILVLRYISIQTDFFEQFDQLSLFAKTFGTAVIHQSLGDLLINSILLLWIMLIIHREYPLGAPSPIKQPQAFLLGSLNYLGITLGVILITAAIKNLVTRSNTSFDFNNLVDLNPINLIAFAAMALLLLAFFLFNYRMMRAIFNLGLPPMQRMAAFGLSLLLSTALIVFFQLEIPILFMLLAMVLVITPMDAFIDTDSPSLTWLLAWLVIFSAFASFLFFHYQGEADQERQQQFAAWIAEGRDSLAEQKLWKLGQERRMASDTSSIQSELSAFPYLGQHYTQAQLPRHFSPAKSSILLAVDKSRPDTLWYDPAGSALFTYYWKDPLSQHFYRFQSDAGESSTVLDELKVPMPFKDGSFASEFEFALYRSNQLISQSVGQTFPEKNPLEVWPPEGTFVPGESAGQLFYRGPANRIVLVSRSGGGFNKLFNLFSFLFALYSVLAIFFGLMNRWTQVLPPGLDFTISARPSLSNQIQLGVFILIICSFTAIGALTVMYFQRTSNYNQQLFIREKVEAIQKNAEERIQQLGQPDPENFSPAALSRSLAEIHQTDLLWYDTQGKAFEQVRPDLYHQGLLSPLMSPQAMLQLQRGETPLYVDPMRVGMLDYQNAYVSLDEAGFLGIPFSSKSKKLKEEVANFIGSLLNIYVFLLLFASSIALIAANSITRPITDLGDRLRQLKLGKNAPLPWNRQDEIGSLIQEYNQMLITLEENTQKLAEAERDSAWKIMARQVAHEISNVLTPLQIGIQHITRAHEVEPENIGDYLKRSVKKALFQISELSRIATEFHSFARMPEPENELFQFEDLVKNSEELYREQAADMDFSWEAPKSPTTVYADPKQIMRVFNNLYKNAIEAIPDDRKGAIHTRIFLENGHVVAEVADNGTGIPQEKWEEVFVPNFTTKSSGTGLGLAISRGIVDKANGRIYFRTEPGKGTSFFVELPLAEISQASGTQAMPGAGKRERPF